MHTSCRMETPPRRSAGNRFRKALASRNNASIWRPISSSACSHCSRCHSSVFLSPKPPAPNSLKKGVCVHSHICTCTCISIFLPIHLTHNFEHIYDFVHVQTMYVISTYTKFYHHRVLMLTNMALGMLQDGQPDSLRVGVGYPCPLIQDALGRLHGRTVSTLCLQTQDQHMHLTAQARNTNRFAQTQCP